MLLPSFFVRRRRTFCLYTQVNMGNCLRTRSPVNDADPGSLTHDASSTAKIHFLETISKWNEDVAAAANLKVFAFADLRKATGNFKHEYLLGEGVFRKVFRGWLKAGTFAPSKPGSGMVVAIKRFSRNSLEGHAEWQSSMAFLGRLSHPNLIKLLGFCCENQELLLVYEFMPKGNLENHLFRKKPGIGSLSWELRLKIAIGAARGLAFLHTLQIIFRDITPASILLDRNYNAKLSNSDFPRLGPGEGCSHVFAGVIGTSGYVAPEYISTGRIFVKSDVYGFGVVLLQMMTGLRAFDSRRPDGQKYLADWLKPILTDSKRLKDIMDARMEGQYSSKAMSQAAQITLRCLEQNPRSRPHMDEVVEVLEQIESMKGKPK